jgi:hypothetical protein
MALKQFERLIDEMLAAQSRFAQEWQDGRPLTKSQIENELRRDEARRKLMELIAHV